MRLLKLLIILLLIVFPFGELLRFDISNTIRIKPLDLLAGIILIYWLLLFLKKQVSLPQNAKYYFIFPLVAFVSLLVNSYWLAPIDLVTAGLYLIRWFSYLSIFLVLINMQQDFKKKILTLLLLDGLIIVAVGFLQFFFFSNLLPLYYLGWDNHMYRLFSVFLDPNYTGGFFALYSLFVGGLLYKNSKEKKFDSVQTLIATPFSITNRNMRAILALIISLTAIAMFLTFSRSTILMFIIGASTFFILIGRKKLIFVLFGFILLFTLLISSKFYIENVNLFRQASTSARISNYQEAFKIISSSPVIGVGFNAYRYAKEKNNITMGWMPTPSHADAGVDNSFLFVLATTGIIGFVAYTAMLISIIKRATQRYKKEKNIYAIILLSSVAGLFVHALFINSLFFPAIIVWLWLINGLMEQT